MHGGSGGSPAPPSPPLEDPCRGALEHLYREGDAAPVAPAAAPAPAAAAAAVAAAPPTPPPHDQAPLLLPDIWPRLASLYGDDRVALDDPRALNDDDGAAASPARGVRLTFAQLEREIADCAGGLSALGVCAGGRVALFAEGSPRWIVADQAVMRLGAADSVRGASAPPEEIAFIAAHSRAGGLIFQDAAAFVRAQPALLRAREAAGDGGGGGDDGAAQSPPRPPRMSAPTFVVLLWGGKAAAGQDGGALEAAARALGVPPGGLLTYAELKALGRAAAAASAANAANAVNADAPPPATPPPPSISPDTLATIVYTSGTTAAQPKGCPLTHGNLAYQLSALPSCIDVAPGDVSLALLPPWHVYARVASYLVLSRGGCERYSSARHLRDDLAAVRPAFLVAVPLLLETLHARVVAKMAAGGAARAAVAAFLVAASEAHVLARRRARGVDVRDALLLLPSAPSSSSSSSSSPSPSLPALFVAAFLAARRAAFRLAALLLLPLHALARLLVWRKVRDALAVQKAVVSGGASLPPHLDLFFEAAGVELTSGWGLTECSPVLACRVAAGATEAQAPSPPSPGAPAAAEANVRGTVGRPLRGGTELRVVDPDDKFRALPDGAKGLVLARGPGVFGGYLDDPKATAAAFVGGRGGDDGDDGDGGDDGLSPDLDSDSGGSGGRWFSTGDLGFVVPASAGPRMAGCVVLCGRAKDTIVLLSGENVEPEPIEAALAVSPLIKHALVVGQDRRELGVLVFPSDAAAEAAAASEGGGREGVRRAIEADVARLNASRPGGVPCEHLARVGVAWGASLSPEDGTLTRTFKVRRPAVLERYGEHYAALVAGLRGASA